MNTKANLFLVALFWHLPSPTARSPRDRDRSAGADKGLYLGAAVADLESRPATMRSPRPARQESQAASSRRRRARRSAARRFASRRVTARINRERRDRQRRRGSRFSRCRPRYRLYVSKAGYVSLEYGQARPFEAGKPLDIASGQTLEKIDFSLPRGSVITGRITDEFGDPVTDVQVQAMRYQFANGERQLANAGRVSTTDDLGQFRIFGLMPGDYVVRASLRTNPNAASTAPNAAEPPSGLSGHLLSRRHRRRAGTDGDGLARTGAELGRLSARARTSLAHLGNRDELRRSTARRRDRRAAGVGTGGIARGSTSAAAIKCARRRNVSA